MQTFYWPVVAALSAHYSTEHVLFVLFLLTKLIFFAAVGLLVASRVRNRLLGAGIIMAIALSGMLNGQTPIGGTIILDEISEHAALALAIVLLSGVLLVEGRWRSAAIAAGLALYVDALPFVHMLPAFALFAMFDWRERKRQVISAALLGAGVCLPWFLHFRQSFLTNYPGDYVSVLLIHSPLHLTLRWTPISQIIEAATILFATACMCFLARKSRVKLENRLELLCVSYLIVMLAGVLAGWFWLTPSVARFMLSRADALLIPYAFLLIQVYGASLLQAQIVHRPAATCLLAVSVILFPLCIYVAALLVPAMILWLDPRELLDRAFVGIFGSLKNPSPQSPFHKWRLPCAGSLSSAAFSFCSRRRISYGIFGSRPIPSKPIATPRSSGREITPRARLLSWSRPMAAASERSPSAPVGASGPTATPCIFIPLSRIRS